MLHVYVSMYIEKIYKRRAKTTKMEQVSVFSCLFQKLLLVQQS